MSDIIGVMPATDFASKTAARWGTAALNGSSHVLLPIAGSTPAARLNLGHLEVQNAIQSAGATAPLTVCYFGHGQEDSWAIFSDNGGSPPLTFQHTIVEGSHAPLFNGTVVVSIACLSGKSLGKAIAAHGGVFVGFENTISWRPQIEQTETALGLCLAAVVRLAVRLGRSVTRQALVNVFADHISYWRELSRAGDGGDNAGIACNYLTSARDGMIVIP